MATQTPADVRDHLEALARANVHELDELRKTPIERKLLQLWSLMSAARLLDNQAEREAEAREIRERWDRFRRTLNA